MGFNYASTTLMLNKHDSQRCEHADTKMSTSLGDGTTQRWLEDIHLDDKLEEMSKNIQHIDQVI